MKTVIKLAKLGYGTTSPNPMVGAVIVKKHKIIAKGYHKKKGDPHAEIIAIQNAGKNAKDGTLYVNLEPCSHYGATPPCTKAIISAGIKEVHVATIDPSPWCNGKGIKELKSAGIKTILGECNNSALQLNESYFTYIKTGLPFVILKCAITLDGKIATPDGLFPAGFPIKWITSQESRKLVHHFRKGVDAVLVGINTIIADNPQLTYRGSFAGKNPKKLILDSKLSIPKEAKVLGTDCIIATLQKSKIKQHISKNAKIWRLPEDNGKVDLLALLKKAGQAGIQSILVEGGGKIFTQFLAQKLVNKVYCFIAPKIMGEGIPVVNNISLLDFQGVQSLINLNSVKYRKIGEDILCEGYIK